jgi:hypothetical protein
LMQPWINMPIKICLKKSMVVGHQHLQ